MSLLSWNHADEAIQIVTDTLSSNVDGTAAHFQTKCWALPHLRLVMAGTGSAELLERWHENLQQWMLIRDVTMLNKHAPIALRRVWREHVRQSPRVPPGAKPTATVCHFGHYEETGALVQYAYRSTADFKGEFRPGPAFAVKPSPTLLSSHRRTLSSGSNCASNFASKMTPCHSVSVSASVES